MTGIDRHITALGPTVELTIGPPSLSDDALVKYGLAAPPTITAVGLIDTGATMTTVNSSLIQQLGLGPAGSRQLLTATSISACRLYQVSLSLANYEFASLDVLEAQRDFQKFDVLIGRDILKKAVFHYDGPRGVYTLQFN